MWGRLTAKCAIAHAIASLADYFNLLHVGVSLQVAVRPPTIHATMWFPLIMATDNIIIKSDFSNAFNSLHRDYIFVNAVTGGYSTQAQDFADSIRHLAIAVWNSIPLTV